MTRNPRIEKTQSLGEEIANSVSHGIGLAAALAGAPILVVHAAQNGDAARIVGASVFAASMVLVYLASAIYHALPRHPAKRVFQLLDHGAVYFLIAGTYTPFTLGALRGAWGWTLLGLVWGLTLAGVVLKAVAGVRYPVISTTLYLIMGWLVLIAVQPLWLHVPAWGLFWLVTGGVAYTLGVVFFAVDERLPYSHFVWHLFVLAGTACHFIAVLWYSG